jgi:hypothetical protein
MKALLATIDPAPSTDLAEASLQACSQCTANLGLSAPTNATPAKTWLCGRCGSAYFAVVDDGQEWSRATSSARPVAFDDVLAAAAVGRPPSSRLRVPLHELHRVLQSLAAIDYDGPERRREPRYSIAVPVLALPLGPNFRVIGPAAEPTTINISRGGACFLSDHYFRAAYVAIDFSYAGFGMIQAVLEVRRVAPLLSAHEVAGRWRCRVNPFNFAETTQR